MPCRARPMYAPQVEKSKREIVHFLVHLTQTQCQQIYQKEMIQSEILAHTTGSLVLQSTHPYCVAAPKGNCKPVKATFAHLLRPSRRDARTLIRRAISLTKSKCPFRPRRHYHRRDATADALTEGQRQRGRQREGHARYRTLSRCQTRV